MSTPRLRLFAPAFVGTALLATPALAQSDEALRVVVHAGDLNLASPAGAASLQRRVVLAAQSVCSVKTGDALHDRYLSDMCRRAALMHAQPQVDLALANARKGAVMAASGR